jgi:hypothetical protein
MSNVNMTDNEAIALAETAVSPVLHGNGKVLAARIEVFFSVPTNVGGVKTATVYIENGKIVSTATTG